MMTFDLDWLRIVLEVACFMNTFCCRTFIVCNTSDITVFIQLSQSSFVHYCLLFFCCVFHCWGIKNSRNKDNVWQYISFALAGKIRALTLHSFQSNSSKWSPLWPAEVGVLTSPSVCSTSAFGRAAAFRVTAVAITVSTQHIFSQITCFPSTLIKKKLPLK